MGIFFTSASDLLFMLLPTTIEICETVIIWNYMEFGLSLYRDDFVSFSIDQDSLFLLLLWIDVEFYSHVFKKKHCWYSTLTHDGKIFVHDSECAVTDPCYGLKMSSCGILRQSFFQLVWNNVCLCNYQCWASWLSGQPSMWTTSCCDFVGHCCHHHAWW